jgi:HK97 family phage major capsid protein
MYLGNSEIAGYRLSRLIGGSISNEKGLEHEIAVELAERAGESFDPHKVRIPWQCLRRDMTAAGNAGYLVSHDLLEPLQALAPWSVAAALGVPLVSAGLGNVSIPRIAEGVATEWLSTENDPVTVDQPLVGSVTSVPRTAAAVVRFSRLFQHQSGSERFLEQHVGREIGRALDRALINGSGTNGEPLGILKTPGVVSGSIDLVGDTWSDLIALAEDVELSGASVTGICAHPSIKRSLRTRAILAAAGSGWPIWDLSGASGVKLLSTIDSPDGHLILGDWARAVILVWGDGPSLALDPYTFHATGMIQMRLVIHCDTALQHPQAFGIASVA